MALRPRGSCVINLRVSSSEMISPRTIVDPVLPKTKEVPALMCCFTRYCFIHLSKHQYGFTPVKKCF